MATSKIKQAEAQKAIEKLREFLQAGDTVYTVLRHVSSSGMSRSISPMVVDKETGTIQDITYWVATATGWKVDQKNYGIKVGGCGMDMGWHLVYTLSRILFPNGFDCIQPSEEGAKVYYPSNDHSNYHKDCPLHHSDGGYALVQRWI